MNGSLNEGTPAAVIEAVAAARPMVTTPIGSTPDLIRHKGIGRLIPPRRRSPTCSSAILRKPRAHSLSLTSPPNGSLTARGSRSSSCFQMTRSEHYPRSPPGRGPDLRRPHGCGVWHCVQFILAFTLSSPLSP